MSAFHVGLVQSSTDAELAVVLVEEVKRMALPIFGWRKPKALEMEKCAPFKGRVFFETSPGFVA